MLYDRFIPRPDKDALAMMTTFADRVEAQPAKYMLSAADVAALRQAVDAFAAAQALVDKPDTKTRVTVANKDDARRSAEQIVRLFGGLIKRNAGISDADKIAIGVRPMRTDAGTRIGPPTSSPILQIIGATPQSQTVRFHDSNTPNRPAKPFGATSLQLFCAIGDSPANEPEAARFVGAYTRNPIGVGFESKDGGKYATYFARWATRRGEVGPWSLGVSMHVAA